MSVRHQSPSADRSGVEAGADPWVSSCLRETALADESLLPPGRLKQSVMAEWDRSRQPAVSRITVVPRWAVAVSMVIVVAVAGWIFFRSREVPGTGSAFGEARVHRAGNVVAESRCVRTSTCPRGEGASRCAAAFPFYTGRRNRTIDRAGHPVRCARSVRRNDGRRRSGDVSRQAVSGLIAEPGLAHRQQRRVWRRRGRCTARRRRRRPRHTVCEVTGKSTQGET